MNNITFVMIKPDAVEKNAVYAIMRYFYDNGISVCCFDVQQATSERVTLHYGEHFERLGQDFANRMLELFVGKTVIPIVLTGEEGIIAKVRGIVGVTEPVKAAKGTIRGDLGDGDSFERSERENRVLRNLIHASDTPEAVAREAHIWLPGYPIQ
ncbi:MAG: nucleoside-diphosphate kinase [Clostridia bacterium]|nr:nucleoside-diphosphate kinase [Clostridia bacterium]MDR3644889.1 nucleoside-diphosphate kinase [Clostridia bacterium]